MSIEPPVSLRAVTADNWLACAGLAVAEGQRAFLPANVYSISAAQFYADSVCRAIHAGEELVGFAMYGLEQGTGRAKLFRLMVDAAHQRRGHGRAALALLVDEIARRWGPADVYVSYQADNAVARSLYERAGFAEVERAGEKVTARRAT